MVSRDTMKPSLDPDFLLIAYANGYFPMAVSREGSIEWFSPDPRAIIPLDSFKTSRSLARTIRKGTFHIRVDTAFESVIRWCAKREETWISEEIVQAYCELHRRGYAHSVEAWHDEQLAGGLYGVALRGAFFGESMFSRITDASKVALVALVERLKERHYTLLDTQYMTEHLRRFGAIEIPRSDYLQRLAVALSFDLSFTD